MAHERIAKSLDINLIHLHLTIGSNKKEWKSPRTGEFKLVEKAVLDYYLNDGWQGYSFEGGLILNLIKAMSFPQINMAHRSTFIEALYAKNVSFDQDLFTSDWLLKNVQSATTEQIKNNFKIMTSKEIYAIDYGDFSGTSNSSMLDFFPSLELYMFLGLFESLGNNKIFDIAKIFSADPYRYRKGWPDLTIWKNGKVKFLEIKSPGDRLNNNQKDIITSILKPLNLDFSLVDVIIKTDE